MRIKLPMSRPRPAAFRAAALLAAAVLAAPPALAQDAAVADRAGLFLEPGLKTAAADVAVDAAGRLHAAFIHYAPDAEAPPAAYAACKGGAEACRSPEDWRIVPLGAQAREVQVAVTPEGRPRLLIVSTSQAQPGGLDYAYAECDVGCGDAANWTVTPLATSWDNTFSSFTADRMPQRTFALDPQGRPRFLYSDRNYLIEPDHYGTFYMSCEARCADRANWTETDIARHAAYDTEIFDTPALAFTPDGWPRVASRIFAFDEAGGDAGDGLYYLACDAACTQPASWRRVEVIDAGGGTYPSPTWDLAIDAEGRPRIAFFSGDGMEQAGLDHSLIYLWCDAADCLGTDEAWNGTVVAAGHGEAAALALDAGGRPRMAFLTDGGDLAYAWCDAACETVEGAWQAAFVEGEGELSGERPTALPFTCDGEVWEGLAPELALDGAGRPLVAYDVSVEARCLYQEVGDPVITYNFNPIWRGARFVTFAPPR